MTSEELNESAFPEMATMMDMLAANRTIAADSALAAFVEIIKNRLVCAWEASENLAESALLPS